MLKDSMNIFEHKINPKRILLFFIAFQYPRLAKFVGQRANQSKEHLMQRLFYITSCRKLFKQVTSFFFRLTNQAEVNSIALIHWFMLHIRCHQFQLACF